MLVVKWCPLIGVRWRSLVCGRWAPLVCLRWRSLVGARWGPLIRRRGRGGVECVKKRRGGGEKAERRKL